LDFVSFWNVADQVFGEQAKGGIVIESKVFKTEFIPSAKRSEKLMIVLHGKGDSAKPFQNFNQELGLPEMNYLLLNAPMKFMGGYSWYKEPPYMKSDVERARQSVLTLLNEVMAQGWKPENIFLFGFSQGCLVSADVALHFPYKLGGVIGISGYFHFFPRWRNRLTKSSKRTPWLLTHGKRDDVLPIENTKFGVEKLKQVGLDVKWAELNKSHVLKEEEYPLIRKWVRNQLKDLR
jgi:phospholipase/carboxylesterase